MSSPYKAMEGLAEVFMDLNYRKAVYDVYCSVFNLPSPVKLHKKSVLLTSLMGAEDWSWKVVGVSEKALECLERGAYSGAKGLQRAHIVARIDIAERLFNCPTLDGEPLPIDAFFERFMSLDKTVLVDSKKSENKTRMVLPKVVPVDTSRTVCRCLSIGYEFSPEDSFYFRSLHEKFKAGEVSLVDARGLL